MDGVMKSTNAALATEMTGPIPRSHVTIYDVAEKARVSPATVSRVLAGFVVYKPATKQRVFEAVRALGYVPNQQAQKLASMRVPQAS
jgi:hypothetical protein